MTYKNNKLLLPGTINVNDCWFLARSNPVDRQNDIKQAITKWLERSKFEIIFVENSNADLSFLDELKEAHPDRLETLSFDGNNYDRSFGKGHGEILAINYGLDHSEKLRDEKFFHKVAGRYFLTEIEEKYAEFEEQFGADKIDLVVHIKEELFYEHNSIPTVYFGITRELYDSHLRNFKVHDNHGIYLEHGMYKAFTSCLLLNDLIQEEEDKLNLFFVKEIGLEADQVSGTNNHVIEHLK